MSAVPTPWCPTCGPARFCNCGVVESTLREWLRANEQRTARAAPRLIESQPDTFVRPVDFEDLPA